VQEMRAQFRSPRPDITGAATEMPEVWRAQSGQAVIYIQRLGFRGRQCQRLSYGDLSDRNVPVINKLQSAGNG